MTDERLEEIRRRVEGRRFSADMEALTIARTLLAEVDRLRALTQPFTTVDMPHGTVIMANGHRIEAESAGDAAYQLFTLANRLIAEESDDQAP